MIARLGQYIAIDITVNMSNSLEIGDTLSNYYFPYFTKQDYDRAFNNARLWALNNPEEPPTAAAQIYHVKEDSVRKLVC